MLTAIYVLLANLAIFILVETIVHWAKLKEWVKQLTWDEIEPIWGVFTFILTVVMLLLTAIYLKGE